MNYAETTIKTATIANGAQTSDEVTLTDGQTLVGIITPAALTSTAMTFTASDVAGGTFVAVRDVGGASAYSVTVAAGYYVPVDPRVFAGVRALKCVAGSAEGAARSIKLMVRNV